MRVMLPALVALLVCVPALAEAQMVQRPQRPYRGIFGGGAPPDPNRNRQELTLTAAVLGGYDDWIILPGAGGGAVPPAEEQEGGATAFVEGTLQYFRGRDARSLSADVRGATSAQRGFSSGDAFEASGRVRGVTALGPLDRIELSQAASYEPTLSLASGMEIPSESGATPLPDSGAGTGVLGQRSWFYSTTVGGGQSWNARHVTGWSYVFSQRTYLDELGFDMTSHVASLDHAWNIRRSVSLDAGYRYSDISMVDASGIEDPSNDHALQFGATYSRRLSPSRQLSIAGRAGATHVRRLGADDRVPVEYWTPVAEARTGLDVGRTWAISAEYRRAIDVLPGVTLQSFTTDDVSLRADGGFGSRIEAAISATFTNGRSDGGDSVAGFETYMGTVQVRAALARWCAATLSYDYYYYQFRDIPDAPTGLPPEYDRNAIRIGFTFWLPLYGSYAGGPAASAGRN